MLKRKGTRATSLLLAVILFLSLSPSLSQPAHASGARIDINNLYVNALDGSVDRPDNDNLVPRMTTNPIDITAYINNISDALVPNIYYEIYNVNTGATVVEKMNRPLQNGNLITFHDVYLSEGLNKITLKLGETNVVSSAPGWAYFSAVTNITSLMVNGQIFEDGGMYPRNMQAGGYNTSLNFSGTATNATDVQAYVAGDTVPKSNYFVGGMFSFSADHVSNQNSSLANIFLSAGDNRITFVARNSSNSYQLQRNFVYDNGKPFGYNAAVTHDTNGDEDGGLLTERLIDQPTVTSNEVNLTARIKVPLVEVGGVHIPQYPFMTITVADETLDIVNLRDASTFPSGLTRNASLSVANQYDIYNFAYDATLNTNTRTKFLTFTFYDQPSPTLTPVENWYSFTYMDDTLPYVNSVYLALPDSLAGESGDQGVRMNDVAINSINELPKKLRVFTDRDAAGGVKVYINGEYKSTLSKVTDAAERFPGDPEGALYVYELSGLANGNHRIEFIPVQDDQGNENLAGTKGYDLNVSSAPYVIMDNIYNGMILNASSISGPSGEATTLSGRLVNVPVELLTRVEVAFNDGVPQRFVDADFGSNKNTGKFKYNYTRDGRQQSLAEGRNVIRFYIYSASGQLVSQVSYEIFVYSTSAPAFVGNLAPLPAVNVEKQVFFPAQNPDSYSTNETSVKLSGRFSGATTIRITARSQNAEGIPVAYYTSFTQNQSITNSPVTTDPTIGQPPYLNSGSVNWSTGEFTTLPIKLNPRGETIFEVELTNSSNITVVRTVAIAREPLPYIVTRPALITNDRNESQATINSNFQVIEIVAEYADQVLFGREEAYKSNPATHTFTYEAKNLKAGRNVVRFTVVRGTETTAGTIVLFNSNTPVESASYKAKLSTTMNVFNGELQLRFPRNTSLMRNEESSDNQYLSVDRELFFGIANPTDGRVDRSVAPDMMAANYLAEPTLRFRSASKLFWIDTGTITPPVSSETQTDLERALLGSGRLPYSNEYYDKFYSRNVRDLVVPTQQGTLTLQYDSNIRSNAWRYLTVYHFGFYENSNGQVVPMWKNLGGVVNQSRNTITVGFDAPGYYQVMYMARSFQDITNHPWARDHLDTLYSKGIMVNKTPSSFVPNDFISRGEFATLITKIFELPLNYDGALTFEDVGLYRMEPLADYKYIETAARAGIIRGVTETQFMPNISLSREDAAVIIARAADLRLTNDAARSLTALQRSFTDANSINTYALASVEAISRAGFIEGRTNVLLPGESRQTVRFDPRESITRAEAAAIAIRVMQNQGKIPK